MSHLSCHAHAVCLTPQRSSVEHMVSSYSTAWPRLAPRWVALQAEQAALGRELDAHGRGDAAQALRDASYMLHHPTHGAAAKMRAILDQERQQLTQIEHAQRAHSALDAVQQIRTRIVELQRSSSFFSSGASDAEGTAQWSASFLQLEQWLVQLSAMDAPAMSQAHFFVQIQREVQHLRENKIKQLLQAFQRIVRIEINSSGGGSGQRNESKEEAEEKQQSDLPSTAAAPLLTAASILTFSVHPSAALPLPVLFSALHSLRASDRCIRALGSSLLRVLEPLLAFVSSHRGGGLDLPLHFATIKHSPRTGKTLRVTMRDTPSSSSPNDNDHADGPDAAAAPTMEGSVMDVILTVFDFVWQQVFSAAPTTTTAASQSTSSDSAVAVAATVTVEDRPASMHELGLFVCPRLQPLLLRHLCDASIPRNVADLLTFPTRLANKLKEFEQQALQRGLMRLIDASPSAAPSSSAATAAVVAAAAAAADVAGAGVGVAATPSVGPISSFLASLTSRFEHRVRERVLQHTKMLVVNNGFDTKKFANAANRASNAEQQRDEEDFPSLFYETSSTCSAASAASSSSSGPAAQSHSLLLHNSQLIFSRSTHYAISKSAFAFVRMIYELYFEAFQARETVGEAWSAASRDQHTHKRRARSSEVMEADK